MENRDFDKWIKDGLAQINPQLNTSDWDKMSSLLNEEDLRSQKEDAKLDELVRLGLGSIIPEFDAADWDKMSSHLDQEDNTSIDELVKLGLTNVNVNHHPMDWDKMNRMLDEEDLALEEAADTQMDEAIRNGLHQIAPTYQEEEWESMKSQLEREEKRRREFFYLKMVEAVIVVLALWFLYQLYPSEMPHPTKPLDWSEPMASIENNHSSSKPKYTVKEIVPPQEVEIEKVDVYAQSSHHLVSAGDVPVSQFSSQETNRTEQKDVPKLVELISSVSVSDENDRIEEFVPVEAIAAQENIEEIEETLPDVRLAVKRPKRSARISLEKSIDGNFIHTAYNSDVKNSFSQSGNLGFSMAVKSSIQLKWWELETGLKYIHKSYRPVNVYKVRGSVQTGYEAETVEKITFNIAAIPLNMRFYLSKPTSDWQFYVNTGASLNTVLDSNYERYVYNVNNYTANGVVGLARSPKDVKLQKAGILNGDSFFTNSYMTAHMGLGVERRVNNFWSVFAQPTFNYFVFPSSNGLGPNNDRFDTFSFNIGARMAIL